MEDSNARLQTNSVYQPNQWASDINAGWEFFRNNISSKLLNAHISLKKIRPENLFPARLLTKSEQSVALRHILAIEIISRSNLPSIVLEDDALVTDELLFIELLDYLKNNFKDRSFFDLADDYIPLNSNDCKTLNVGNLQFFTMPIAITRTLMAYAMSPKIAHTLLESLSYYSLPIDMQIQASLSRLLIPGLSIARSPLSHGSKSNCMVSSVKQK
tara:strand:- start:584 stop:1228 length:645 start_codon:yes stop_codon:yes gene_type:complete